MTNIAQHVPTKETCLKMKELGWSQDSDNNMFVWGTSCMSDSEEARVCNWDYVDEDGLCAAPLATEILEELPDTITVNEHARHIHLCHMDYSMYYDDRTEDKIANIDTRDKSLAEALALMWCYLKENKLMGVSNESKI